MSSSVTTNYVKLNSDFKTLNIVGVLLGGSVLYKKVKLENIDVLTDWDGIILVKQKSDIVRLVNNFRKELCDLLAISEEEYSNFKVPFGDPTFNLFDGVRFVGRTAQGVKKGTKILSVDYFNRILRKHRPSRLNILSFKDSRVSLYKSSNHQAKQYQIQQASYLDEDLYILHDMDIYVNESYRNPGTYPAIFGAATDLLMSGTWVYDDGSHSGEQIVKKMFYKFCRLHVDSGLHYAALPQLFKNYEKFHSNHSEFLKQRFQDYMNETNEKRLSIGLTSKSDYWNKCYYYYWGNLPDLECLIFAKNCSSRCSSDITLVDSSKLHLLQNFNYSAFSANCQHGSYESDEGKFFWKRTPFMEDDLVGSEVLAEYYNHTHLPEMIDYTNKVIFYPFFDGDLLSYLRLKIAEQEFKSNWYEDSKMEIKLLNLELQRAADILRAFCSSAKINKNPGAHPTIHRFFWNRLTFGSRLHEFYFKGLKLPNARFLTIEELKHMNLIINCRNYGSLNAILKKATQLLKPTNFINEIVVNGLGDGHNGNILVEKTQHKNSSYRYRYIDYEVAGWHSPMLDIAKPFFIDIFFNLFYADLFTSEDELFFSGIVQVQLADDESALKINLTLPMSPLSNGIYEIKKRYLLIPFLKFIEKHPKFQLNSNWPTILGHALLMSAIFSRNYSKRSDVFFVNLALGVICSAMKTFDDDEEIFKMIRSMNRIKTF